MTESGHASSRVQLEQAMAVLEAQRATLGDAVVEAALGPMREKLAALVAGETPKQQRKLATILFMDIAGHTSIVRDLDPEENMELIDSALARLDDPVFKFGGHIARYQGDGFKAVFGLPSATEDDPANAVLAGLEILSEASRIAEEIKSSWGIEFFNVRVGIDTGFIFAGGETEGEDTIKGNPVNMAARLESATQPGTVLISHNTYQHVRGHFEVLALEPIKAKGYPQPVQVYQVLRARDQTFPNRRHGIEGFETRMVGRDYEMTQLQGKYRAVIETGEHQFVTIEGDGGIGKSRLVYEFEKWVDQQPQPVSAFHTRARAELQSLPFSLLRDLFASQFGIQDDDPAQSMRSKFENGIQAKLGDGDSALVKAHFIGHLLGYDFRSSPALRNIQEDPKQIHDRALSYMIDYLKAASRSPILVLLEDLHWADESSLNLVTRIFRGLRGQPVYFIATTRPVFFEHNPRWMEDQDSHHRLGLFPLDDKANHRLIAEILPYIDPIPPQLIELVCEHAEGNPYYTEELIKKMIEDGVIIQEADRGYVNLEALKHLNIPPTLVGLLQARLDSLPQAERSILQQASVVGRVFWDAAVQCLNQNSSQGLADQTIAELLGSLQLKELVYPRAISTFREAAEYIFQHAALQEVTYESVLLRLRRGYHASVAEWLVKHSRDRVVEIAGLIADHLEKANETEEALKYLHMAGDQASATFANHEAVEYFIRALQIIPAERLETRFELLLSLNHIYDRQGNYEAQGRDLPVLESLAESIPGDPVARSVGRAKAAQRRSKYHEALGQFEQAARAAEKTVRFAGEGSDATLEAAGLVRWVVALWRQGFYDQALELAERALALSQDAGIGLYEAHALVQVGNLAWFHKELDKAARHYEQALPLYREINYLRGLAAVSLNLALVQLDMGNLDQAENYMRQALEQFRMMGDKQGIAQAHSTAGGIARKRNAFDLAIKEFENAFAMALELGDRNLEAIVQSHMGEVFLSCGDTRQAGDYISRSHTIASALGNRRSQCFSLMDLSLIYALNGEYEQAYTHIDQAWQLAEEIGLASVKALVLAIKGYSLLAVKDYEQAQRVYEAAYSLLDEIESPQTLLQVRTGLARLALAQGDLDLARRYTDKILTNIDEIEDGEGVMWFLNHLTCLQVLQAAGDPRASEVLESAYELLCQRHDQVRALGIQQEFIENIPWHQEIFSLWEKRAG